MRFKDSWARQTNTFFFRNMSDERWKHIYRMPFECLRETKYQSLQYRVVHRIIPCNYLLYRYKIKDSDKCEHCNRTDDIMHYFCTCEKSMALWNRIWTWLAYVLKIRIQITEMEMILGIYGGYNAILRTVFNAICVFTKFFINRQRLFHGNVCAFEHWYKKFKIKLQIMNARKNVSRKDREQTEMWEYILEQM